MLNTPNPRPRYDYFRKRSGIALADFVYRFIFMAGKQVEKIKNTVTSEQSFALLPKDVSKG